MDSNELRRLLKRDVPSDNKLIARLNKPVDPAVNVKAHRIRNWLWFPVKRTDTNDVLDLIRVCAVHDRPFAARYILNVDGIYRHQGTIRVTEKLYRLQIRATRRENHFAGVLCD
jgi:hypothetical protein